MRVPTPLLTSPGWPTSERLDYLFRHAAQDPGAQRLKALLQRLAPQPPLP